MKHSRFIGCLNRLAPLSYAFFGEIANLIGAVVSRSGKKSEFLSTVRRRASRRAARARARACLEVFSYECARTVGETMPVARCITPCSAAKAVIN